MKNFLGLNIIKSFTAWIAILFPLLIVAGKAPAEIATITLALCFVVYIVIAKDFRFLKEKWFIVISIFWLYFVIRSFFTPDVKHALEKSFPFIRFILLAACLQFLVDKKTTSKIFVVLSVVVAFLVLDGFIQFFMGHDLFGRVRIGSISGCVRLTGPFSKQVLGTTIATLGVIVIAGLISLLKRSRYYFLYIFLGGFLIYIIIFLAGERAAFLRFLVSITLLWFMLFLKAKDNSAKRNFWIIAIAGVLCSIMLLKVFLLFKIGNVDRQLVSPIRNEIAQPHISPYLFLWKTGLKAGFSNILFGIGPNQFASFCQGNPHPTVALCGASGQIFFHPHNIWLELFAESGLIGVILFAAFLYIVIKKLIRFYIICDLFENALIIGIALAAFQRLLPLPSSGFFKNWYAIPIWFAIGWMLSVIRTEKPKIS